MLFSAFLHPVCPLTPHPRMLFLMGALLTLLVANILKMVPQEIPVLWILQTSSLGFPMIFKAHWFDMKKIGKQ